MEERKTAGRTPGKAEGEREDVDERARGPVTVPPTPGKAEGEREEPPEPKSG